MMSSRVRIAKTVASRSLLVVGSSKRAASRAAEVSSPGTRRLVSTTVWKATTTFGSEVSPFIPPHHQFQTLRGKKHAAKMGNHLEVLDEMAHSKEREQARERRKKNKERKEKKKNKGKKGTEAAATSVDDVDNAMEEESAFEQSSAGKVDDQDHGDEDHSDHDEDEIELPDTRKIKEKMMGIVSKYEEQLKYIRGAEPTPELFDDVKVNAYGSENTPLKAVAQVVITSPTMGSVTCFDPALVKEVKNSIQLQLGLNPQTDASDGDAGVLKVPIPKVSMETRQKTAAQLNKKAESFRQKIRRVRRRYNNIIKSGKEGKLDGVSKDDVYRVAQEIDDVTDQAVKKLNDITENKHQSIMDV